MDISQLPSRLLENAVNEFSKLPGIGKKTALRLVLHLLNQSSDDTMQFANALIEMKQDVRLCKKCNNITEEDYCSICTSKSRDESLVCVVESIKELIAIESTSQYNGVYHILGGRISPMDGVGPKDLHIDSLIKRVNNDDIAEVILALSTNMEGDTTSFYVFRRLEEFKVPVSTLARGISIGDELEYTDEITLGKSLLNRMPYQGK